MRPVVVSEQPLIGALMELSTERQSGMGAGSIPVSKIWDYLDRFNLPDWWEPVLLQADASIVAAANKDTGNGRGKATDKNGRPDNDIGRVGSGTGRSVGSG